MRSKVRLVILGIYVAGLSGCGGPKGAKLQQSVIPPDKTLFQNGLELLDKNRYTEARLMFQNLIRTYPGSEFEAEALLKWGDSYYQEGGTANLLLAEEQYKNFIIFFPTHPKAADAQLKIAAGRMKLINTPDRDTHDAVVAEAELKKFLAAYPNSEYVPVAKQYLDSVQDVLAKSYMVIGDQYSVKGNYASPRYREVIEQYPRYSQLDETYFKLAQNDLKTGNVDEAAKNLGEIVRGYPFSKYNEPAKALLEKLGKPLPAVDQQLAAQHQALLKPPEPFSPLKPLIAFAEAIGFKGPPDRFEEAQKIVARDRAAAEEKAASQSGKPGDVMINAVIEKGPDGKAVVNPNVTPPKTDKKDETKKDAKKQDDKTITKK